MTLPALQIFNAKELHLTHLGNTGYKYKLYLQENSIQDL